MKHTGIQQSLWDSITPALSAVLDVPGFTLHSTIQKLMEGRRKTLAAGKQIDWATGEALAFASLLAEGTMIALIYWETDRLVRIGFIVSEAYYVCFA